MCDRATLLGIQLADVGWERGIDRGAHRRVQRRMLGGRDLLEPVARAALPMTTLQHAIEEMLGRCIHDNAREVLATHQVHVIDAQIGRYRFVADRPVRSSPLDYE